MVDLGAGGLPFPVRLRRRMLLLFNDLDQASTGCIALHTLRREAEVASREAVKSISFASMTCILKCRRPGVMEYHEFASTMHALCCSTDRELLLHLFLALVDVKQVTVALDGTIVEPEEVDDSDVHRKPSGGGPPESSTSTAYSLSSQLQSR